MGKPKTPKAIAAWAEGLATTPAAPSTDANTRPDSPKARVTPTEIARIVQLAQGGLSCREIGLKLDRHHSTISSVLEDLQDTASPAQLLAKAKAYEVQEKRIAAIESYDQATDFLEREGVVQAKQQQASSQTLVFVGNGVDPIGPKPTFAIETVDGVVSCNTPSPDDVAVTS
jgi:DNA-binding CsgD family transcriptional regulator